MWCAFPDFYLKLLPAQFRSGSNR